MIFVVTSKIVRTISYVNLRLLVLLVGLFLAFGPNVSHVIPVVDRFVFLMGSYLFETPSEASKITIVNVPEREIELWQNDIYNGGQLSALLANLLHSKNTIVGIVIDRSVASGSEEVDSFIQRVTDSSKSSNQKKHALALQERKNFLYESFKNPRVIVGVEKLDQLNMSSWTKHKALVENIPAALQNWFWNTCLGCEDDIFSQSLDQNKIQQFPILYEKNGTNWLYFSQNDGEYYPGFLGKFLAASIITDMKDFDGNFLGEDQFFASWDSREKFSLGDRRVRISYDGSFFSMNNLLRRMHPNIESIALEEALARRAFPQAIFIASEKSEIVKHLARSFYSLKHDRSFAIPWWYELYSRLLTLFIAVFLFLGVAYLSNLLLSIVTWGMFVFISTFSITLLVTKGLWLPVGNLLLFLFAAYFVINLWKEQHKRSSKLAKQIEELSMSQADMLVNNDRMDEAGRLLLGCNATEPVLHRLYDYAESYSTSKKFDLAIGLYSEINSRKKNYRDVPQKLHVLKKMLTPEENPREVFSLEKTTVLGSKSPSDPSILGRYEVNQEIGRGAVGRVFLGFDPRIARKVAIKTLNYDQFEGNQLEDIKSRFFREAEAAGRLSHPNIVSVYDVGEEGNLAYIAMDYVEGKPLNQFVDKANLLPVFEVYRIICDVASAIDYAHGNNVVHRDIKPGNIMYSPSPYQVKVTDFGIARLVDDSRTSTGEILGSPLYMAPEQLKGKRVTQEADVFSLGVTFYQLLTGELPFKGDNLASLTYEIIHGKHKNIRTVRKNLPASAARIVNQALQKDVKDRYESAAEMLTVLKRAMRRDFSTESKNVGIV